MQPEVNEKTDAGKGDRGPIALTLIDIPRYVHNKLKRYRRKINNERQADFNIKAAYDEFLKEATKNL